MPTTAVDDNDMIWHVDNESCSESTMTIDMTMLLHCV